MKTRITIGGRHIDVPDDLATAILDGLTNQRAIEPPTAEDFNDLIPVISGETRLIQHLKIHRELTMAKADATSPYADRRAIGTAASMSPSQVGRVMERTGRPRNRRATKTEEN
ncbi:hypothetical protein [Streptomyces sp. NBC_01708]|uniref:hypothetical protein n=1 Tax=Streptomyces sp. NBC_01708 TaxID=2975915 RepID=UPI002E316484|nr:hypothetical protein [Streptomyces sp. NBC_01708]